MRIHRAVFLTIFLFTLAIILALAVLCLVPSDQRLVLSAVALVIFVVALFFFDNFIVKPYIFRYARRRAREIQEAGQIKNRSELVDIKRTLSKSKDEESKQLLQKLEKLEHKGEKRE